MTEAARSSRGDRSPVAPLGVRVSHGADVGAIVGLVESAYRGDSSRAGWTTEADLLDGQRTDVAAVEELLATPGVEILLAKRGRELVGCCQLERRDPRVACFGLFAVRPDLQGRGVGRWLIGEAERRATTRHGSSRLRMTVLQQRAELIAWYGRLGYTLTGEHASFPYGDERFGVPRHDDLAFVVLEKRLEAPGTRIGRDAGIG